MNAGAGGRGWRRGPLLIVAAIVLGGGALALGGDWFEGVVEDALPDSAPGDDVGAELREVAARIFANPRGKMSRTLTAELRASIQEAGTDLRRTVPLRVQLVNSLIRDGEVEGAVAEIDGLFELIGSQPGGAGGLQRLQELRGLVYLRRAEVENCIARHNEECCVFPLQGGGVHAVKGPAEEAAASYLAYLEEKPEDLTVRWLLNITHMAMGTYPESVPREYLIPAKGPGSTDDFPRFREVAVASGIARVNHAGGAVMEDMDGDGLLDLVLSSAAPDVPLTYYHNEGDGTFADRTAAARLGDQLGGLNLIGGDYDGDGDQDLFVLRGAWLYDEGTIRNSLLRNDGGGVFTDVTRAAGLADPKCPTQCGVWLDYDNDGRLDLFVGNESRADPKRYPGRAHEDYPCNLFRNNGDGTFTDVARQAGVTNDRYTKGATAGDYDNDGWTDLYVSNMGVNRLYRNEGDGTFTDVAERLGVTEPANSSFVPWFFDFDNDGHLDIFVAGYDTDRSNIGDVAAWHLGLPFAAAPPRLYRNRGDGTFEDVTRAADLWRPIAPMGANFGDLDNDGWLDMYLTTGAPAYEFIVPNVMLRNVGGRRFEDVTVAGGFGNLQKGHGVAFGDLDHDGDQDVFNQTGGFYQGDAFYNALYENPGFANRFIVLKLRGTRSNRMAYGARIKVVVAGPGGERAIHRAVGSVGSFGGSPSRQEIGLGDATAIRSVEIWWPASGIRQTLAGLELNAFYEVAEGADAAKKVTPRRLKLGRR